jgi:predicted nucleic acid-binding protein
LGREGSDVLTYLFDASAAVELYSPRDERTGRIAHYILEQKTIYQDASLFIPNFCIAEVFNTLGKKRFAPSKPSQAINEDSYKDCLGRFRTHVHWGKTIYPYELNRYHIIAADQIIPTEHHHYRKVEWDRLSTFDILIISMSCELASIGDRTKTYLVTCDERLAAVFNDLKTQGVRDDVVPGPLGELDGRRWIPPECIYLPEANRRQIPKGSRQPMLNI